MTRAAVITRWVPNMVGHIFAIAGEVVFAGGETATDVTIQPSANIPPSPNVVIVEVNCSDATLAAIKTHAQYGAASVLWEGDPAQSPVVTTGQYNALITFLSNKFGASEAAVRTILGATANGRTRYDIAQDIIAYLRTRPRA